MKKDELLNKIAPCSLVCHTCAGFEKGVIRESAKELLKYLEGMQEFYERHYPGKSESFPCDRTRALFEEEVYLQRLEGNEQIRAAGWAEFWKKNSVRPHYKPYKKF